MRVMHYARIIKFEKKIKCEKFLLFFFSCLTLTVRPHEKIRFLEKYCEVPNYAFDVFVCLSVRLSVIFYINTDKIKIKLS